MKKSSFDCWYVSWTVIEVFKIFPTIKHKLWRFSLNLIKVQTHFESRESQNNSFSINISIILYPATSLTTPPPCSPQKPLEEFIFFVFRVENQNIFMCAYEWTVKSRTQERGNDGEYSENIIFSYPSDFKANGLEERASWAFNSSPYSERHRALKWSIILWCSSDSYHNFYVFYARFVFAQKKNQLADDKKNESSKLPRWKIKI